MCVAYLNTTNSGQKSGHVFNNMEDDVISMDSTPASVSWTLPYQMERQMGRTTFSVKDKQDGHQL